MAMFEAGKLPHRSILNNSAIAYRLLCTSSSDQVYTCIVLYMVLLYAVLYLESLSLVHSVLHDCKAA